MMLEVSYILNDIDRGLFSKDISEEVEKGEYQKVEVTSHVDDLLAIPPLSYASKYIKEMKKQFGEDLVY